MKVFLFLCSLFIAAAGVGGFFWFDHTSSGPLREDKTVVFAPGQGFRVIADTLEAEGVIRHALPFKGFAILSGDARRFKPGEYVFPAGASAEQIIRLLGDGKTVVRKITVPEGLLAVQIHELIRNAPGLTGELPATAKDCDLLPETYHYSLGDSRESVLKRMQSDMQAVLRSLWPARQQNLPFTTAEEAVILASIVETETGLPAERAHVASVYINRLRLGMPLQADPTAAYAVTDGQAPLSRALTRADLETDSPYNTYKYPGLPPGPIANPGRASIEAVLQPEEHNFIYFVADGSGGHIFAATLDEHNKNVAEWRKIRKSQN